MKKLLEAVNVLLGTIGELQITNEDDLQYSSEAQDAILKIDRVKRRVLSKGYKFNTYVWNLQPDTEGFISVPPRALSMEFKDNDSIVVKEGLLYDTSTNSFNFDTSLDSTITWDEDFDTLPLPIQELITAESAYYFQREKINDQNLGQELQSTWSIASRDFKSWEIREANAKNKDPNFDRKRNPTGGR